VKTVDSRANSTSLEKLKVDGNTRDRAAECERLAQRRQDDVTSSVKLSGARTLTPMLRERRCDRTETYAWRAALMVPSLRAVAA
jgi:hypothetical protein